MKDFFKEGLANKAYELFRKMEVNGCLPDDCSYNVLIQGFLQNNDISTAAKILPEMVCKGFSADISTATMFVDLLSSDTTGELIRKIV